MRLRAPMMSIHTVAAGGGSICTFDGARFRVGPESAGANPGPAAYRRGVRAQNLMEQGYNEDSIDTILKYASNHLWKD